MPVVTSTPEVAVAAVMATAWAIDFVAVMLPLQAPPGIHMGITAYAVTDGVYIQVSRTEHDIPQAVVLLAMAQPPAQGAATVYDAVRTGFYGLAQAAGLIPADAVYQAPPAP